MACPGDKHQLHQDTAVDKHHKRQKYGQSDPAEAARQPAPAANRKSKHAQQSVKLTAEERAKRAAGRAAWKKERRAQKKTDPAIVKARAKANEQREDAKARIDKIRDQVVGKGRQFPGTVLRTGEDAARYSDHWRLHDVRETRDGTAVYWTDASECRLDKIHTTKLAGKCMGAGVVWQEKTANGEWEWRTKEFSLGHNSGSIRDAELYGISAAMALAKQEVETGKRNIEHVRIFSDDQSLLNTCASQSPLPLGPLISTRLAIHDFYESADWLVKRGLKLELVWVKGHSTSEGNKMAHQTAGRAAKTAAELLKDAGHEHLIELKTKAPKEFEDAGEAWAQEWLFRANKSLLIRGGKAVEVDADFQGSVEAEIRELMEDDQDDQEVEMDIDDSE